jgi:hypothetical protein
MSVSTTKAVVIAALAFAGGVAVSGLSSAIAAGSTAPELSTRKFNVFVDEVKQNLVFGDQFSGHYKKTFTLSDGSKRNIELTPMVHDGMQVVRFKDTGGVTYMSLTGTTTNGTLMVHVRDQEMSRAALQAQGWQLKQPGPR